MLGQNTSKLSIVNLPLLFKTENYQQGLHWSLRYMHEGSLLFRTKACGVRHLTKHEWVLWSVSTILPTLGVLPGEALCSRHRCQTEIMGVNPHGLARASSQAVGHSSDQAHYMWPHLVSSASHIVAVAEGNWAGVNPGTSVISSQERRG